MRRFCRSWVQAIAGIAWTRLLCVVLQTALVGYTQFVHVCLAVDSKYALPGDIGRAGSICPRRAIDIAETGNANLAYYH